MSGYLDGVLGGIGAYGNVSGVHLSARGVVRNLGTVGSGNRQIAYVHR